MKYSRSGVSMNNIAYIFQPHYNTGMFRVAKRDQFGKHFNYIVVTCSPSYNGVWKYSVKNLKDYKIWSNDGLICYCVPIDDCEKIMTLDEVDNPTVIKNIKLQQKKWCKLNNSEREDWML